MIFNNSLREFYMYYIIESLTTKIDYKPIQLNNNEFEQFFTYNDTEYQIQAFIFNNIYNYNNILSIGFNNISKHKQNDNESLTNDASNPTAIFGILLNWTNDFLNKHKNVNHIVFTSKYSKDVQEFNKRTHLYYKLVDKFLTLRSDFFRDETLDTIILPKKFTKDPYKIFAVTKLDDLIK